jgi:hypothetical protein
MVALRHLTKYKYTFTYDMLGFAGHLPRASQNQLQLQILLSSLGATDSTYQPKSVAQA